MTDVGLRNMTSNAILTLPLHVVHGGHEVDDVPLLGAGTLSKDVEDCVQSLSQSAWKSTLQVRVAFEWRYGRQDKRVCFRAPTSPLPVLPLTVAWWCTC